MIKSSFKKEHICISNQKGFTLTELMITLAIIGILASLGVPAFQTRLANQQLNDAASKWVLALSEARAESTILRDDVRVELATSTEAGKGQIINLIRVIPASSAIPPSPASTEILASYVLGTRTTSTLTMTNASDANLVFKKNRTSTTSSITVCGNNPEGYKIDISTVGNSKITTQDSGVTCE